VWCEIIHSSTKPERDKYDKSNKEAASTLSEIECRHILKRRGLLRKLEISTESSRSYAFIINKINLSLYPEYFILEVISKSRLSRRSISNDYKTHFKVRKCQPHGLETWGLLLHIQKHMALHLSTCFIWVDEQFTRIRAHMTFNLKLAAVDLNWATQHVSYWLVRYQRPLLRRQEIRNLRVHIHRNNFWWCTKIFFSTLQI
jgi:hypothetical protein